MLTISFFGSSLVSAYWNGAATYYRGLIKALHQRGHRVTFYEPDAFQRQQHRDLDTVPYARSVVYEASSTGVQSALARGRHCDVLIKASGVGVFDEYLEEAVLEWRSPSTRVVFWDVDAPATLDRVHQSPADHLRPLLPEYDLVFTYGGGIPVIAAYLALGAKRCVPIYNGLDPDTHHPVAPDDRFAATLAFLGNRMPDREDRVREFFFQPMAILENRLFLLGGSGWEANVPEPPNLRRLGHVYTRDHNAFNRTPLAILNISRDSMARYGFSPATRVFEAAGAGACLITDAWEGIDLFLEPGKECLVAQNGAEVAQILGSLTAEEARQIGSAALRRVLQEHTYSHRVRQIEEVLVHPAPLRLPSPAASTRLGT